MQLISECKEWHLSLRKDGYGSAKFRGKTYLAHRMVYEKFLGVGLPPEIKLLHRCDNRKCVNVEHLFRGTQQQNIVDMVFKGRHGKQKKDTCPRGHKYDYEDMVQRYCFICKNEHVSKNREKVRLNARISWRKRNDAEKLC